MEVKRMENGIKMNERIKELAEQARELATTRHPVSNIILSVNSELFEQNFAKLIIEEYRTKMIETVQNLKDAPWSDNAYPAEPMVVWLSSVVENHFGVNE